MDAPLDGRICRPPRTAASSLVRDRSENETRPMRLRPVLADDLVTLEPADPRNVSLLIRWSLDPIAQGPLKRVPNLSTDELRSLFLADPDRSYFVLRRSSDATPLGRFYWRAWRFRGPSDPLVDWELNIFLADPRESGRVTGGRPRACPPATRNRVPRRGASSPSPWPTTAPSGGHCSRQAFSTGAPCRTRAILLSYRQSPVNCSSGRSATAECLLRSADRGMGARQRPWGL